MRWCINTAVNKNKKKIKIAFHQLSAQNMKPISHVAIFQCELYPLIRSNFYKIKLQTLILGRRKHWTIHNSRSPRLQLHRHSDHSIASTAKYSNTVTVIETSFSPESLRSVLTGQGAVVSCIARIESETELKIIAAAESVGVQRFLPSQYGADMQVMRSQSIPLCLRGKRRFWDIWRRGQRRIRTLHGQPWYRDHSLIL
jgi:hypothetical protein